MRVPCIPLHEISMFGIMFISVFCSIGAIRLYLFDSPAALKNIFHDEVSLVDGLRAMYSNKQNYLNFLDRNFNDKARRSYVHISYAYYSLPKKCWRITMSCMQNIIKKMYTTEIRKNIILNISFLFQNIQTIKS